MDKIIAIDPVLWLESWEMVERLIERLMGKGKGKSCGI